MMELTKSCALVDELITRLTTRCSVSESRTLAFVCPEIESAVEMAESR